MKADAEKLKDMESQNIQLISENAFLQGKIDVYERFLAMKGFLNDADSTVGGYR